MNTKPLKKLEIKKGTAWELWMISPTTKAYLGSFNNLEELNQVQITLYQAWEKSHYPRRISPVPVRH